MSYIPNDTDPAPYVYHDDYRWVGPAMERYQRALRAVGAAIQAALVADRALAEARSELEWARRDLELAKRDLAETRKARTAWQDAT